MESLPLSTTDILTLGPIVVLLIILLIASNKEIKKSREQSSEAQKILANGQKLPALGELAKDAEFGRLSQGIIHDLMTPLTSLILHTEHLGDNMTSVTHRMTDYMKDVRATLAREETARECSIRTELDTILHLLAYKIRHSNVHILIEQSDTCSTFCDPVKLRQIFLNLVSNALDSFEKTPDKKKEIRISIIEKEDTCTVVVSDNGCGISTADIDHIFKPFFTTKNPEKGTGIGLTTVKNIIEKDLGGTIGVESTEGHGSTFTISFPLRYRDPASSPQPRHTLPLHE